MRFLLYNIRYAAGIGRHFHFPVPYSGYFKNTNGNMKKILDFIGLQHDHVYRSKYPTTSVAQKLPLLKKQGNAILTNQEIISQKFHYFQEGVKRLVIELELTDFSVFLVHLSIKFRHRQYQLQDLHNMVKAVKKPVIVAGDFNVLRGNRELRLFLAASGLKSANSNGQPSHPSRAPRRQLDYIFHSPEIKITDFEMPQVKFSDHTPLVCEFNIAA
jgi:endonuclease/exonuclease/phosphatase family metal-dependent hydrolase